MPRDLEHRGVVKEQRGGSSQVTSIRENSKSWRGFREEGRRHAGNVATWIKVETTKDLDEREKLEERDLSSVLIVKCRGPMRLFVTLIFSLLDESSKRRQSCQLSSNYSHIEINR